MEPLFQIKNLYKSFSLAGGTIEVIKNLSLDLPKGEWLALTGPSGCGKTTLLHILAGLDRPTSGDILLDGQNIAKMSSSALTKLRKQRIGFVFQSYMLFPELSALENAALPALWTGSDLVTVSILSMTVCILAALIPAIFASALPPAKSLQDNN